MQELFALLEQCEQEVTISYHPGAIVGCDNIPPTWSIQMGETLGNATVAAGGLSTAIRAMLAGIIKDVMTPPTYRTIHEFEIAPIDTPPGLAQIETCPNTDAPNESPANGDRPLGVRWCDIHDLPQWRCQEIQDARHQFGLTPQQVETLRLQREGER